MKSKFIPDLLNDLRVALMEAFDRNFERKAFFDKPWPQRKLQGRGSLLVVRGGGGLRGSLRAQVDGESITFSSNQPHGSIHNEGGTITVTPAMKRYFWAMHFKYAKRIKYRKDGRLSKTSLGLGEQAQFYKNLALMRTGSSITMPERRFIGPHPVVDNIVRQVTDQHIQAIQTMLKQYLNKHK